MAKKIRRGSGPSAAKKAAAKPSRKAAPKPAAKPRAGAGAKPAARPAPHTPLFCASLAVSLDGYISDKSGGAEWLNPYFTPEIDFGAFMKTIGATIYGRTTYDWAIEHGFRPPAAGSRHKAIILTRRPIPNPSSTVETFAGDVRGLAARLRHELYGTGKDIWLMGGGLSIAAFHEAGLVDRWELSILPVLLGEGIPLFPKHSRGVEGLRLTHSRVLKNGIVEVWYEGARGGQEQG